MKNNIYLPIRKRVLQLETKASPGRWKRDVEGSRNRTFLAVVLNVREVGAAGSYHSRYPIEQVRSGQLEWHRGYTVSSKWKRRFFI
ncbi:hypothetical protein [Terribacillus halophilus]|uniref:hypothetical protein n=1 Tax=Terribacillus halophilus TaxID=361279 RepID=UPI001113B9D3|nr:hypothetical protein [Terribacillus halophilus]